MFETLEPRRMLTVTTSFASGVLTVTSDHAPDRVRIAAGSHAGIFVYAGHVLVAALHTADAIRVNLGDGDDSLVTENHLSVPMTIHGGLGNDDLTGGTGRDQIFGDDGNDVLRAHDGSSDTVDGGAGVDTAYTDHVDVVTNVEHIIHPSHPHHPHHHDIRSFHFDDLMTDRVEDLWA